VAFFLGNKKGISNPIGKKGTAVLKFGLLLDHSNNQLGITLSVLKLPSVTHEK